MGTKRKFLLLISAATLLLVLSGITYIKNHNEIKKLDTEYAALNSQLNQTEQNIATKQAEETEQKTQTVKKVTGLDPGLIQSDSTEAEKYFVAAFSWSNGAEYEGVRNQYIESLGEDNSFTKTYLPPDTKIETNDGMLSYIDFKNLRTTMDSIYVVPITAEGNRVRYVAFVQYIMHKDGTDLENTDALERSEAIIEFTAAGESADGERRITEVSARAGYSAGLLDN
ncbi:hypothetical protein [Paenibacillus gallinarum]|uniref:Uncharacterized protein n=1 Tax=Paenibacillus gallinarum TaxID=2762232 RepID=A0ABR8T3F3_9BACL|nr:hypothetical protein [Paenibacillus gallinarum]MBD7970314.1 hypothetical protein [Paenibacillus gallinarum]